MAPPSAAAGAAARKPLRYVEVLNLPEDPEYMQNAGFIVDLRQKQIDVQKEVAHARDRLVSVTGCIEALNKVVAKRFTLVQYSVELSRKKDERDRKGIVKRLQATEGQMQEAMKGVDDIVKKCSASGGAGAGELLKATAELRKLLTPPTDRANLQPGIVDKMIVHAARAAWDKGVLKKGNLPMNIMRASIPAMMEQCETGDDFHTLSQVSAHLMVLAEQHTTFKGSESSLSGKQAWIAAKIEEIDNKITARVRTAFKRLSIKKHPDKLEAPTQADYEVFEEITNAKDVLSDPVLREQYTRVNNHAKFLKSTEAIRKARDQDADSTSTRQQKDSKRDKLAIMGGEPGRCTKPHVMGMLSTSGRRVQVSLGWGCHSTAVPVNSYRLEACFGGEYGYETVYEGVVPQYTTEILPVEEVLFRACGVNSMGEGEFSVPLSLHPQDLETQRMQEMRLRNERREQLKEEQQQARLLVEDALREILFVASVQRPSADILMRLAQAMDNFVAHRCTDKDLLHQTKEELRKLQMSLEERELVATWRSSLKALAKNVADEDDDLVLADEQIAGMANEGREDGQGDEDSALRPPDIDKLNNACGFHALLVSLDASLPPTVRNMVAQYVLSALEKVPRHAVVRERLVKLSELALAMDTIFTKKNLSKIRGECERIRRAPPYVPPPAQVRPARPAPSPKMQSDTDGQNPEPVVEVGESDASGRDISSMTEEEQLALAEQLSLMTLEEDRERLIAAGILPPSHTDKSAFEVILAAQNVVSPTPPKAAKSKANAKKSKNNTQQPKGTANGGVAQSSSPHQTAAAVSEGASPRKGAHARASNSQQTNEHEPKPRAAPAPAARSPSPPASPAMPTIAAEASPVHTHAQSHSPRSAAGQNQVPVQQAPTQHVPVHVQPSPSASPAAFSHMSTPEQHASVQAHASPPVFSTPAQHVPVQTRPPVVQPSPQATPVMFGADSMYSWDQAMPAPSSPTPLEGEESFWAEIHETQGGQDAYGYSSIYSSTSSNARRAVPASKPEPLSNPVSNEEGFWLSPEEERLMQIRMQHAMLQQQLDALQQREKSMATIMAQPPAPVQMPQHMPPAHQYYNAPLQVRGAMPEITLFDFLSSLGMANLVPVFEKEDVDMNALRLLDDNDLVGLGLPKGPRVKLLHAIQELDMRRQQQDSQGMQNRQPPQKLNDGMHQYPHLTQQQQHFQQHQQLQQHMMYNQQYAHTTGMYSFQQQQQQHLLGGQGPASGYMYPHHQNTQNMHYR